MIDPAAVPKREKSSKAGDVGQWYTELLLSTLKTLRSIPRKRKEGRKGGREERITVHFTGGNVLLGGVSTCVPSFVRLAVFPSVHYYLHIPLWLRQEY